MAARPRPQSPKATSWAAPHWPSSWTNTEGRRRTKIEALAAEPTCSSSVSTPPPPDPVTLPPPNTPRPAARGPAPSEGALGFVRCGLPCADGTVGDQRTVNEKRPACRRGHSSPGETTGRWGHGYLQPIIGTGSGRSSAGRGRKR